ncbi:hypothetical protein MTR67_043077 [Solanum verrucosum]|uniref:Uncharacterized protein n=1 Tax=Solanum verrucosum TaxID=315347 RepID=A0AAF0UP06_SOLVR|nr:hypothetical protein MTR67_043077 [Solanum verrucosum]
MHQWNLIFEIRKVSFMFRSSPVRARSVISKLMCAFSYHCKCTLVFFIFFCYPFSIRFFVIVNFFL